MQPPYQDHHEAAEAPRIAASQDNVQPRHSEHQVVTNASEATNKENSITKTVRIAARVAQLKELLREQGNQYVPHIRSEEDLEEFEEAMELLDLDEQRSDRSAGYPSTEDGFAEHCNVLFEAMTNLVNIDEAVAVPTSSTQAGNKHGKDSHAVKFIKSKKTIEMNIVAGKLMRAMRKAQLGRLSLAGRKFHEYDNFTLRFQAVANALRASKLLVKSAFEGEDWIARIAINPEAELYRKRFNKTSNDGKNGKLMFANMMKKRDPSINFEDATKTTNTTMAPATTPAAPPSHTTAQAQQSNNGTAAPSDRRQMEADTSQASPPPKRIKTSQGQDDQPEAAATPSANDNITSQNQQLLEGQAGPGSSSPSAGMLARGRNGQATQAQGGTLALDPNPLHVPGPIQQYDSELYDSDDSDRSGQSDLHSGRAGLWHRDPSRGWGNHWSDRLR